MDWGTQSIQAVWFSASAPDSALTHFAAIIGGQPTGFQTVEQVAGNPATTVATGVFEGYTVSLQSQPGRVDIFLSAPEAAGADPAALQVPLIVDFDGAMTVFGRLIENASNRISAHRVALVSNLTILSSDAAHAVKRLMEITGFELPFDDANEMLLRLNRRTVSKVYDGMPLNRLMTWKIDAFQQVALAGNAFQASMPVVTSKFGAGLSIDINTALPPKAPFTSDQAIAIFGELSAETRRLTVSGSPKALG